MDDSKDRKFLGTDHESVLESGAEEDTVSFASAKTLPTWYRRLMSAFRADLVACRHVDLGRLAHRNICICLYDIFIHFSIFSHHYRIGSFEVLMNHILASSSIARTEFWYLRTKL